MTKYSSGLWDVFEASVPFTLVIPQNSSNLKLYCFVGGLFCLVFIKLHKMSLYVQQHVLTIINLLVTYSSKTTS